MKKIGVLLTVVFIITSPLFSQDFSKGVVYGVNSITTYETEESLTVEIVLSQDSIKYYYSTKPAYKAHFQNIVDDWNVRLMLGHNVKTQIEREYKEYSEAAFNFGNDMESYLSRTREDGVVVYIFDMYKSPDYEVFLIQLGKL